MNALVIRLKTLSCLSVKTHLHCSWRRHRKIQLFSTVLWVAQSWSSTGCDLSCLASLLRAFTSPTIGGNQIICPRRLLYLVCIAGVRWRSSFVFFSSGISSKSLIALSWLTLIPDWECFIQRIPRAVKSTSFQSSEPTWKSSPSLARPRCSISVPPVPKRSSAKRFKIAATDFPVAGLPSMGSNIISNAASSFDRTRDPNEISSVPYHCVEHVRFQFGLHVWVEYNT